jgi:uncharacterized repeat protein (TIGR03803 family)
METRNALRSILAIAAATLVFASAAYAANNYKVLHDFLNAPASYPLGGLAADSDGNLYGTARDSNAPNCGSSFGCGAVFKLTREANGRWSYSVIHRFRGSDGKTPTGGLVIDRLGNLYGSTEAGGPHNFGTVFELSPFKGGWTYQIIYGFGAYGDVANPYGALTLDVTGNLYGAASAGPSGWGGIFELVRKGHAWRESVLHIFQNGSDGAFPEGNMVLDSAGNLYGTTLEGGSGLGVVFRLAPRSNGTWEETTLHAFAGRQDSAYPIGGLSIDTAGNLYGTASGGDPYCRYFGCGVVFELSPGKNWTFHTLHTFRGPDGVSPVGPPVINSAGDFYGVALYGGRYGSGVLFKVSHEHGPWAETVIHSFNSIGGEFPSPGLLFEVSGIGYGTTAGGGVQNSACSLENGCGVIFSITP